MFVLLRSECVG